MHRSAKTLAIAAATATLLAACSGGGGDSGGTGTDDAGQPSAPPVDDGSFVLGVGNDPGNLDPSMTVLSVTRTVSRLSYDTLVHQRQDGSFVSQLATDWQVGPQEIEFTLDPDVTCSDGSPLTATDVKDNLDYITDPENQSPLLGVFVPAGLTTEADDEAGTVTVTAPEPNAFLLNGFTNVFILCRSGLDDHDALAQETHGTGPWVLSEAVADDHYTYTRRADYAWGPDGTSLEGEGVPEEVVVRVIANPTTLTNLVLSGEVNAATVIGADADRLDEEGVDKIELRSPQGEFVFNQAQGQPGSDPAVRQALLQALNIEALATVATGRDDAQSVGLVTTEPKPCQGDTVSGNLPTYDTAAAAEALDAAGWSAGPDGVRAKDGEPLAMTFIYPASTGDSVAAAAELVEQMWREAGADVTLQSVTSTQLNEVLFATGDWDAGWVPITVSLPSQLVPFFSGPAAPDGTNFGHLDNATYDESSAEALATGDTETACELWNEAEEALISEGDVVPMFDAVAGVYLSGGTLEYPGGELDGSSLRLGQ
ncbi:ABC transporter substrate-binding protein [uncultured Serinicoccus sp.]|uniref:ABC transporter substrate-binding protein n=1 Tax=uncultured Serinicoccus sp. TaxID=735514 RepID=UPI00261797B3|nr:ABC transporter substrate-binding protein [uncultured Serinicoccus sp.]